MANQGCICYSCGQEKEFSLNGLACDVLDGWFIVSAFNGNGAVERYSFCSFDCLQEWVLSMAGSIPDIFINSLDDETGNNN